MLLNLLSNAIKYNRRDGDVTVRCLPGPEQIELRISDTGIGLAPDRAGACSSPSSASVRMRTTSRARHRARAEPPARARIELLRRLRADGAARVPAIAVSASAMPADIQRALQAGFAAYLTKAAGIERTAARGAAAPELTVRPAGATGAGCA